MGKLEWNKYMREWNKKHPHYYNTDKRREYMREYMRKLRKDKKEKENDSGTRT